MKIIDLTLPEWGWIDGGDHETKGNELNGRQVFTHLWSATVLEVFDRKNVVAKTTTLQYDFEYLNIFGIAEQKTMLLHYSAKIDRDTDEDILLEIMAKGAKWYCDYCQWEDKNILSDELASMN